MKEVKSILLGKRRVLLQKMVVGSQRSRAHESSEIQIHEPMKAVKSKKHEPMKAVKSMESINFQSHEPTEAV